MGNINFDCAVFAAGDKVDTKIIHQYCKDATFCIAADAGYKACITAEIKPDLLVGDYDSSKRPETDIQTIQLNPIKDETDTAYALEQAIKRGYKNIVLFGATGGRLDHEFANIELCASLKNRGISLTIIDNHHKIFTVKNESVTLQEKNKYISIFPIGGPCTLTLQDLDYPLQKETLPPFCGLGVSNEMHKDNATILAEDGMALVMIVDKD